MKKSLAFFVAIMCGVSTFLLYILYLSLKMIGGSVSASEVGTILPLVIEADVSLLAFWGLVLVFRINELSSQRIEITNNLWELSFRRDDIWLKMKESKGDGEKIDFLTKLYDELGKDATMRRDTITSFYELEGILTNLGLLAASFFVLSICSGFYGISTTFHAQSIDAFTYITPIICVMIGTMLTIFALLSSSIRLEKNLEIRQ